MYLQRWRALNATIFSTLEQASARWQQAKQELATLKSGLPEDSPPGIIGLYAHLKACFDTAKSRNAVIARFGQPPAPQDCLLETLLVDHSRELRGTETRTGQLCRIFEATLEFIESVAKAYDLIEALIEKAFFRVREHHAEMVEVLEMVEAKCDFRALEIMDVATKRYDEQIWSGERDREADELNDLRDEVFELCRPMQKVRDGVGMSFAVVLGKMARLGINVARQSLMTEFVEVTEAQRRTAVQRRNGGGDGLLKEQGQGLRQTVMTEFVEVEVVAGGMVGGAHGSGTRTSKQTGNTRQWMITKFFESRRTSEGVVEQMEEGIAGSRVEG